ncbi:DUF4190 domain-containing protein [Candidatus Saccharibacteria bacterium]|nr:DUF4190 domain-containing protein [Candidatus Saccharibacteria bacterium]
MTTPAPTPEAPQTPQTTTNTPQSSGFAIASLILGAISLTGPLIITGLPAVIFGWIGLRRNKNDRGLAIAGIIMGGITTLISLILIALAIIFFVVAVMFAGNAVQSYPDYLPDDAQEYIEPQV